MSAILKLSDLNTTVNHEPRVRDLLIAERLAMKNPHSIRLMIEANRAELETYGPISVAMRMVAIGSGAQREVTEYWLNEGQALVICALSRTPNAAAVRKALIDVYLEYRNGGKKVVPVKAHMRRAPSLDKPRFTPEERRQAIMAVGNCLLDMLNAKDRLAVAVQRCGLEIDASLVETAFNDVWRQLRRPLIAGGQAAQQ